VLAEPSRNTTGGEARESTPQKNRLASDSRDGESISQAVLEKSRVEIPALPALLCETKKTNLEQTKSVETGTETTLDKGNRKQAVMTAENNTQPSLTSIITTGTNSRPSQISVTVGGGQESKAKSLNALSSVPTVTVNAIGNLAEALDAVCEFLTRYIRFEEEWMPGMIALWAAHTWTYDCFGFTPYLHIYSPDSNCGKSTLLNAVGKVSRKPWTPVAGSEAALYIKIEQDKPTILMDEVDAIFHEKSNNEAMRAILNAGYSRGGMVPRAPRGILQEYNVFGPKALAGIGQLPSTIENRSIHIFMQRQPSDDRATRWRTSIVDDETQPIREFFTAWVPIVHDKLKAARPNMPQDLDGRHLDIIEPLIAIADLAGETWPDLARNSAVEAFMQVNGDSDNNKLLRDLRVIFEAHHDDTMTSHDIVEKLVRMCEDAPWAQWWERAIKNEQYSAPQSRLAKMLKGYHIKPRNIRATKYNEDEPESVVLKGYHKADFTDAWRRFLPQTVKMEQRTLI
jgi:hypothetical protein